MSDTEYSEETETVEAPKKAKRKQRSKSHFVDANGEKTTDIMEAVGVNITNVATGTVYLALLDDLEAGVRDACAVHGLKQKLGDSLSTQEWGMEDANVSRVWEGMKSGVFPAGGEGGGIVGAAVWGQAIANLMGDASKATEYAEWYAGQSKAEREAIRADAKIAAEKDRIQAELSAAKAADAAVTVELPSL